ncbi:MAG: ureidoglycolate lyase [Gammaproteobacteria bacterium]|nr:ureidoglycolate lyase [Gammaproteobacteria bacterium]MDH4256664.1 ureidoglycolate lyase [Gammaproteobacteria bacterium]MDH5309252.1 ureidoglycolate lyase [Gammaproteobacteria bacterium]
MNGRKLVAVPITPERFAPFGQVIGTLPERRQAMNAARFERFDHLASIDIEAADDGRPTLSIARARIATALPYRVDMVERHPLGSQAFIPLAAFRFVVVVGRPGESVEAGDLQAFVTNGHQGVNYNRGTWHMPLIALEAGNEFLVVDRAGGGNNCEEHVLAEPLTLCLE